MRRIAFALCLAGTAAAQEPTPEPVPRTDPGSTIAVEATPATGPDAATLEMLAGTYDGLTFDELEVIVKADGYGYTIHQGTSGPYLQTGTVNGVSYEIWLSECNQDPKPRCIGFTAQTFYFKESPKVTLKAINDWNANAWGVRAMLYSDGQSAVAMNIGMNGGVTGNWLIRRLRNFNYWAEAYSAFRNTGDPKAAPVQ